MKYVSIIVLAFAFFANAQSMVKMQSHVQSYLQEKSGKHRSGLLSATDYGSNYEEFREGERIQLISSENPFLSGKESFSEMKGIVSESLGKNFKSVNYYDNYVYLDSCKSDFRMDISNLKKNQNQESKKLLKHLFSAEIAKQFDLFVVGTEYFGSMPIPQITENSYEKYISGKKPPQNTDTSRIENENGYILLFQRVYKGRIIRSTDNYLNVFIDKDGHVKNMEIAWQDLFSTEKFTASANSNLTEITGALESAAKSNYSSVIVMGDTLPIKNFDINGVAKAWCKEIIEGKNVLFPCLSYSLSIEISNGETKSTVIDVPYSVNYKREFMGIAQSSYIKRK
jgi:hypothetical protein